MDFHPAVIPAAATLAAFAVSSLATSTAGMSKSAEPGSTLWNRRIGRSPLELPGWVFGVVWAFLYIGTALVWYHALREAADGDKGARETAMKVFGGITLLNVLWSAMILLGATGVIDPPVALFLSGAVLIALGVACIAAAVWVSRNLRRHAGAAIIVLSVYVLWMAAAATLTFTSPISPKTV